MIKKSFLGLTVCLFMVAASSAWAQNYPVLDTGDPNERVCNPKSYTDNGDGTIRDNVTGLEWQQVPNTTYKTWTNAFTYCDTLVFPPGDDSHADWRLPTVQELATLVDHSRSNPAIDPLFGMTENTRYWTADGRVQNTAYAWWIDFDYGWVNYEDETTSSALPVRAVRGPSYGPLTGFFVNGDGTVSDPDTGLMWQPCNAGQTWSGAQCNGSVLVGPWDTAVNYIENLNDTRYLGYDDWRLPTINELQSILDYSRYNPATTFPDTEFAYWSSTGLAGYAGYNAWGVWLDDGSVTAFEKIGGFPVRAVRNGTCWQTDGLDCFNDGDCEAGWKCIADRCNCQNNAQCDDSVACNGEETCDSGACTPGTTLCAEGEYCFEEEDQCVECLNHTHCDTMEKCKDNICVPRGEIQINKSTVKAGKTDATDSIQISGLLDAFASDFTAAMGDDVIVTIEADYIPDLEETEWTFPIDAAYFNNGTYTSPKIKSADKTDPVTSFACDTNTGSMQFSAKNVDLTGLSCPITFTVQIGAYSATVQMDEDIVNGPKKPCPLQLLMGVYDSLDVTKEKAKKSTKAASDSVSIKGTFTIDGSLPFTTSEPLIITLGADTFTVPGDTFIMKKSSYSCKSFDTGNGLVTAKFDTAKCTYQVSIKNTALSDSGDVDFDVGSLWQSSRGLQPDKLAPQSLSALKNRG